jgi:hypothetical protein
MYTALFVVIVVGVAAFIIWRIVRHRSELKPVIAEFMEAGAARNMGGAYACFSPQSATKEEIAELIENSYDVFANYERLTIKKTEVDSSGIPEAYVTGAITYTGGKRLPFKTSLVKENDVWKITGIHIGSMARGIVKIISVDDVPGGPM